MAVTHQDRYEGKKGGLCDQTGLGTNGMLLTNALAEAAICVWETGVGEVLGDRGLLEVPVVYVGVVSARQNLPHSPLPVT